MTAPRARPAGLFPSASNDFAIGLRPIATSAWLEGGEALPQIRKDALFGTHRAAVWGALPGSLDGQAEILELVDAVTDEVAGSFDAPPLVLAARKVADDLCLMEKHDGHWRLTALSLCAGTFFTAADALGKDLAQLHQAVPGFGERFLARVTRIFDALRPGLVLERRNWTVTNTQALFAPRSVPVRAKAALIDPGQAGSALYIRMERQTLRRLPRTGGAVFTIRIWSHPLDALRLDPERLAAFDKAWRQAAPAFARYKGFGLYAPLVENFLNAAPSREG